MAKKRGGIAGFYDKFKTPLRYGATIGATLLGGPGAGALTNAAFKGFDRPGRRGIGIDPTQAALGAVEGYGIGKSAMAAKGLLTGAKAAGATASPMLRQNAIGATGDFFSGTGGAGINPLGTAPSGGEDFGARASSLFSSLGGKAADKLGSSEVLGGIVKGAYGARQAGQALDEERRQFDVGMNLKERQFAIEAAQEADRKRREEELMATRARVRAMFGGA